MNEHFWNFLAAASGVNFIKLLYFLNSVLWKYEKQYIDWTCIFCISVLRENFMEKLEYSFIFKKIVFVYIKISQYVEIQNFKNIKVHFMKKRKYWNTELRNTKVL